MEQIRAIFSHERVNNLHEDDVKRLSAILLLTTSTFIRCQILIFKVVIAEAMLLELLGRRLVLSTATIAFN